MNAATEFDGFKADALAQGYDEVVERRWDPGVTVPIHTHPFAVSAKVVQGDLWLRCDGESQARHLRAGDRFTLAANVPHDEHYGPHGATYWVARRNAG